MDKDTRAIFTWSLLWPPNDTSCKHQRWHAMPCHCHCHCQCPSQNPTRMLLLMHHSLSILAVKILPNSNAVAFICQLHQRKYAFLFTQMFPLSEKWKFEIVAILAATFFFYIYNWGRLPIYQVFASPFLAIAFSPNHLLFFGKHRIHTSSYYYYLWIL